ncbi:MAG: hypothetical protein KGL35_11250, partial [Bradyrhizobium sp.]|nr:hypothetical protein [Bradyrhizobium sp.]
AAQFGIGNGSQAAFQLSINGLPAWNPSVTAIHRTDWQGRQLLYPTPRTNHYPFSETLSGALLGPIAGATLTSGAASPSPTVAAFTLTAASSAYGCIFRFSGGTSASNVSLGWVVKAGTAAYAGLRVCSAADNPAGDRYNFVDLSTGVVNNTNVPAFPLTATPLPNGYILLRQSGYAPAGDSGVVDVAITDSNGYTSATTLGGQTLIICAPEYEYDLVGGSYISTGSASTPVTLTDYTLAGTTVNLAQAPGVTATTDWDGSGTLAGVTFGAGTQIAAPAAPTLASTTGTLAAATYTYTVTATNAQGETIASTSTSITLAATGGVTVSWTAVAGASGYRVYGRISGSLGLLASVSGLTYTDSGSATPGIASPAVNSTGTLQYPCVITVAGVNHPLFHITGLTIAPNNFTLQGVNGQPTLIYPVGSAPLYGSSVVGGGTYGLAARF